MKIWDMDLTGCDAVEYNTLHHNQDDDLNP
jgi:hypothetical protein